MFGDAAFRDLGFSQASLNDFINQAGKNKKRHNTGRRQRITQVFKVQINKLDTILESCYSNPVRFSTRQEYRVAWDVFQRLDLPSGQPQLLDGAHWPFYVLWKRDVLDYIRWNTNRWLFAIACVLSNPDATLATQHNNVATLSALFTYLEFSINSQYVATISRLAKGEYGVRSSPTLPNVNDSDVDNMSTKLGLDMEKTLSRTNLFWLPETLFEWAPLQFIPAQLERTAYVSGHFQRHHGRAGIFS